jgi:sugar/nucleoside kinase (ribokinase family)
VQKNSPSRNTKNSTGISFLHFPALPASISNLSGAGDCLVAGAMVALSSGADISSALAYGVSASKWAVESDSNVSSNLDHHVVSGKFSFLTLNHHCLALTKPSTSKWW